MFHRWKKNSKVLLEWYNHKERYHWSPPCCYFHFFFWASLICTSVPIEKLTILYFSGLFEADRILFRCNVIIEHVICMIFFNYTCNFNNFNISQEYYLITSAKIFIFICYLCCVLVMQKCNFQQWWIGFWTWKSY